MNHHPLNVLLVEDSEMDASLIVETLEASDYHVNAYRVDTATSMKEALDRNRWDVVISDFNMPKFRCLEALKILKDKNNTIPFILVSGAIGEETAVLVMKAGASDYIMKNNLSRLPSAVKRELHDAQIKEKFIELEKRYQKLVELSPDAIIVVCDEKIVFTNRSGYELFGAKKSKEIIGKEVVDLLHEDHKQFYRELIKRIEKNHRSSQITEMQLVRLDGMVRDAEIIFAPFIFETKPSFQLVIRDITERKRAESLAYHDALTGVSNRPLFERVLSQEIEVAKRRGNKIAIFFIDLDNFKFINDNYGHGVGDKVLKEVANRLQSRMRKSDIVARFGGDEFVIATPLAKTKKNIEEFAKRIHSLFKKKIILNNISIQMSASIGISVYPEDGQDDKSLLHAADVAMYQTKNLGKNNFQFYSEPNGVK